MTQRPEALPEALPLDLLPPLNRDSQISRPNPPGGDRRPVVQSDPAATDDDDGEGGSDGRLEVPPPRLLIGKDGATRSIWPVHLGGWQALGWRVLTPAIPAVGEPGEAGDPDQDLEPEENLEPEPDLEGQQPELPEAVDAGPVPPDPEQPDGETVDKSPQPADLTAGEALTAEEVPDFAAMTKAEIIEHCSRHYGVLLDSGLTKGVLVSEAEALAPPRLPDPLVDDLMT